MSKMQLSAQISNNIDSEDGLIVKVVATRAIGIVTDANSQEFNLDGESLRALVDNYNRRVYAEHDETIVKRKKVPIGKWVLEKILGKSHDQFSINEIALLPVQYEHDIDNRNTIGRVVGLMELGNWDGAEAIFADLLITDKAAIDKIKGGLLHQVSISFSVPDMQADEISFTTYGAVEGSEIIQYSKSKDVIKLDKPQQNTNDHIIHLTKIRDIEKRIIACDDKIQQIKLKKDNKNVVLSLIKRGIIYAKYRKLFENDLNQFSSNEDRAIAIRMLSSLPRVIQPESNRNRLALKAEEILMTTDVENLKNRARTFYDEAEIAEQRKIELSQQKTKMTAPDKENEDHTELSLDTMEKHVHGDQHNADFSEDEERAFSDRMKTHIDSKDYVSAIKEYCSYKKINMADTADTTPTDVKQVPMSASEDDKEHDKDLSEAEKEKAELSKERDDLIFKLDAHLKKYK